MTQKERKEEKKRLVVLMEQSPVVMGFGCTWHEFFSALADDLLSNDVIVPPCKVGDVVYSIGKLDGKVHRETVQYFNYDSEDQRFWFGTDGPGVFTSEHIGKWVFLTREAAERALKELEQ